MDCPLKRNSIFFLDFKRSLEGNLRDRLTLGTDGYFSPFSSETLNRALPLERLRASTLRPFFDAIRLLNPCLLARFLLDG